MGWISVNNALIKIRSTYFGRMLSITIGFAICAQLIMLVKSYSIVEAFSSIGWHIPGIFLFVAANSLMITGMLGSHSADKWKNTFPTLYGTLLCSLILVLS